MRPNKIPRYDEKRLADLLLSNLIEPEVFSMMEKFSVMLHPPSCGGRKLWYAEIGGSAFGRFPNHADTPLLAVGLCILRSKNVDLSSCEVADAAP